MTLVRRFDKMPETPEPGDPLYINNSRVVPTLDDTVPGGSGRQAAIFLVVYPEAGAARPEISTERQPGDALTCNTIFSSERSALPVAWAPNFSACGKGERVPDTVLHNVINDLPEML